MKLTSLQSITDFMNCAGRTLPDNIRLWARRNLAVARSHEVSPEERRHAQRALSIMMNIQWKSNYFESIDPDEARRILDEELYGMERVKQRIIETIIQINRTHTLPAYGILLIGPAGTGKSQIAYAIARILKLPWTTLDMSSINDPEQLTGSSRVYANAKPGIIMEAFAAAGESNLVFIINELDKAASGKGNGNPADVLLDSAWITLDLQITISSVMFRQLVYTQSQLPMKRIRSVRRSCPVLRLLIFRITHRKRRRLSSPDLHFRRF